jgi:hypothetical protein
MAHPKGGYKNKAGKRVPGTTTITGRFKDSGALLWWAFGQGKSAERGEIESLYDKRDEAAEAGTLAHAMIESYIKGMAWADHPDVTGKESAEVVEQATKGFDNARKWLDQTSIEIVLTEPELVSELHQFGGSPDAIGKLDGKYCLLDWKTSNGLYPDFLIQVGGGYVLLVNECLPEYPITGGIHVCRFSKEFGDFHHHYFDDLPEAREQFLLFRQAYENDKLLKKRAK